MIGLLLIPTLILILIAVANSLLGVFVLWKKLSYFGDGLSHSMLLGLIIGIIFSFNQVVITIFFGLFFALLVALLAKIKYFSKDLIIAISSYFCMALALILSDVRNKNLNFNSYIFGDILTTNYQDLIALSLITLIVLLYVILAFKKILLININEDLAKIAGINVDFWNFSFLILLSLTIALSTKIVGVFLMTALLVLPAAIARNLSSGPLIMIILSLIIGVLFAVISLIISFSYDLSIAPTMIFCLSVAFIFSLLSRKLITRLT
jgi:zinc transport system permease protein